MRALSHLVLALLALAATFADEPRGGGEQLAAPWMESGAAGEPLPGGSDRCQLFARTFWSAAIAEPGLGSARTRPDEHGPAKSGPPALTPFERGAGSGPPLPLVGCGPRALRELSSAQAFLRVNGSADAQGARA